MKKYFRGLSLVTALVIFWWLMLHAGGVNEDGSQVDPNPPPFFLKVVAMIATSGLGLYGIGFFGMPVAGWQHPQGDKRAESESTPRID